MKSLVKLYRNGLFNNANITNIANHLRLECFYRVVVPKIIQSGDEYNLTPNKTPILHMFIQLCTKNRHTKNGKTCHAQIIIHGLKQDTLTSNMLMNMYSKCGIVASSRKVFDEMPERTFVSWNTAIAMYTRNEEEEEALSLFVQMRREGDQCTEFTVSSVLCTCAAKGYIFICEQLHSFAIKCGMDSNVYVGTALLDVYAKCGLTAGARTVFDSMEERSDVTWSSMVAGCVQNELYEEGLTVFRRGQEIGLQNNQFMMSSVISACAGLAALIEGKQVHSVVCKTGFGSNCFIASSLIDMYAKCGCVKDAYVVFSDVELKNLVLWNVLISGFAKHSRSLEVKILFEKMQQSGIYPDEVTYLSLLSSFSHTGLVKLGRTYFELMKREHNLSPNVLHYSCMVDILSRAGLIHEAYELINKMPLPATASMWGSILASCSTHKNLELAEVAANNLFTLEPGNAGNYVLLSNVYAANRKWEEAAKARKFLKENEVKKEKGTSWIEIRSKVHTFMVGERIHPRISDIYLELDKLLVKLNTEGYTVETDYDLHDVEESRKQELLVHHSEKLAFTYGHMCLPPKVPIRIMKNLRICGDCHSFMKLASGITEREIIVRDVNRFHHFKSGLCSCGDFW